MSELFEDGRFRTLLIYQESIWSLKKKKKKKCQSKTEKIHKGYGRFADIQSAEILTKTLIVSLYGNTAK